MARALSETARDKMILAAQEIITTVGLAGFSVDQVARSSGVAKTTIYRHFASGDELLLAAIDGMVDQLTTPATGSFRSDLREVVNAFLAVADSLAMRQLFVALISRSMFDQGFAALYRAKRDERHAPIRRVLQRGIASGDVDPEIDIDLAVYLVEGPFLSKRLVENESFRPSEIDAIIDLLVAALAPRSSRAN